MLSYRFHEVLIPLISLLKEIELSSLKQPSIRISDFNDFKQKLYDKHKMYDQNRIHRNKKTLSFDMNCQQSNTNSDILNTKKNIILPEEQATKSDKLYFLQQKILACEKCPHLVSSRHNVVPGIGNPNAKVCFVGEAPGEDEDLQGEPFVGKAGLLLNKIIHAMEYSREEFFIVNILKCRPNMPSGVSGNRKPTTEEMKQCFPWLKEQLDIIQPQVIITLGLTALEGLLERDKIGLMRDFRGKWLKYQEIPVMPTYHPAYLLRNQSIKEKRKVWEDMLLVLEYLGNIPSEKQKNYFL